MAKKSCMEHIASAVQNSKALKAIIKASMQGGWQTAATQALKHYWPQILVVALVLILLPVIIFCCLPAMLFGFGGSMDTTISSINVQASTVSGYYDKYEEYCNARVSEIKSSVTEIGSENNGNDDNAYQSREAESVSYEITVSGEAMAKNWFISLHSVSMGNDLNEMDEQSVKDFVVKSIVYTLEDKPKETSESVDSSDTAHETESNSGESGANTKILTIRYLTPLEFMTEYGYSNADRNWAQLMYRTLQEDEAPIGGSLGSPFPQTQWKKSITSEYGYRVNPKPGFHSGLDIGMPKGTEIYAVKSGTVKKAETGSDGYGYHIIIDHGNGIETLYAHCSELLIEIGQKVDSDTVIAKVGSTGDSTGSHLHIEIRVNGETVDPFAYLS